MPGPIFANVVLVDEINRTTPRTQSALLEAMDENAVTVDGVRHALPDPMFVVATQNPIEHHGTYPLPEGQLDRFAIAMEMGYLDARTEQEVVRAQIESRPIEDLTPVVASEDIRGIRAATQDTHVAEPILAYALEICRATRLHPDLELGASPRASISLVRCAQARALLAGRDYVVPDDVKALAVPALAHRILPVAGLRVERSRMGELIEEVVAATSVPVAPSSG
jgi:MoxR-like ATPase